MVDAVKGITPVPRADGDHAANAVHAHLRGLILEGSIPPGSQLNQVELAPLLGVSRTPLREAIRMLQEEGLVEAEPQKRARVASFDPTHLESVYAQRVLLEGLGALLTAPTVDDEQLATMDVYLDEMEETAAKEDLDAWTRVHRSFHLGLVAEAGPHLLRSIMGHMDRGEHYRLMYGAIGPRAWIRGGAEHRAIVAAYRRRDGHAAASELAAHLARTALSLVAQLSPSYDPKAIRAALAAIHAAPDSSDAQAGVVALIGETGLPRRRRRNGRPAS